MNMSNSNKINQIQNSQENLLYLFSQRKVYSVSKKIMLNLFITNLVFYILGLNDAIQSNNYFKAMYVFWGIIVCLLYIREEERINVAATMQELIDRRLYGFDTNTPFIKPTYLHQMALNIKSKFPKEYESQISCNGENGGVRDWYSDVSGIPLERAILLCQIENCEWEIKLRKWFQSINIGLFISLIFIYVAVYWNNSVETFVIKLYPVLTIVVDRLVYIYRNNKNINESNGINEFLYRIYDNIEKYSREDILNEAREIQSCIYSRRKNFAPIPDFFYNLSRKKDQTFSNQYISDLKGKLKSPS